MAEGRGIALVGPTHPYSGGISHHTTTLANRLQEAGHRVEVVSWRAQYPRWLRDGDTHVPEDEPEVVPLAPTTAPLAWYDPIGWYRAGRRLRGHGLVVYSTVSAFHAIPFRIMAAGAGRRTRQAAVVHNVVPHLGGRPWHRWLNRLLYRRMDAVIVHSERQRELALPSAGRTPVVVAVMPLPDLVGVPREAADPARSAARELPPLRLLFFGMVRPYKGVDVLLEALAGVPGAELVVAGEFWQPVEEFRAQAERLGIADRVELRPGYVPIRGTAALFAAADALVLPYRGASASNNVELARRFGLPVVATDVGTFSRDVRDGVDGLIVPPGDPEALAAALRRLADPELHRRLRAAVPFPPADESWARYAEAVASLARARAGAA